DVVQCFVRAFKEAADVAAGLADALLVLDHRDADEVVAELAEADARCHRNIRLLDEELRELHRTEAAERLRNRRPGEHRRPRRRNGPPGATETVAQRIATPAVDLARLRDALLRAVERRG